MSQSAPGAGRAGSWTEVLAVFLRLGLTSFGGPVAHLGYFRDEFVTRRGWLDDRTYADLVALCQFLPGPASSQVGIAIGLLRAGDAGGSGWLHGLKDAAVAVVAQAVLGMMRSLAPDRERATMAVVGAVIVLAIPTAWGQVGAIVLGALAGTTLLRLATPTDRASLPLNISRATGGTMLAIFFVLLVGLPLLASTTPFQTVKLFDAFYRA